ncbi:hypothetical protein D9M71_661400 [compost metagenome]
MVEAWEDEVRAIAWRDECRAGTNATCQSLGYGRFFWLEIYMTALFICFDLMSARLLKIRGKDEGEAKVYTCSIEWVFNSPCAACTASRELLAVVEWTVSTASSV